jgi:hypothetical protein
MGESNIKHSTVILIFQWCRTPDNLSGELEILNGNYHLVISCSGLFICFHNIALVEVTISSQLIEVSYHLKKRFMNHSKHMASRLLLTRSQVTG